MGKLTHVNLAICTSTMTVFAVLTKENVNRMRKTFHKIMLGNVAVMLLICVAVLLFGPYVIRIYINDTIKTLPIIIPKG